MHCLAHHLDVGTGKEPKHVQLSACGKWQVHCSMELALHRPAGPLTPACSPHVPGRLATQKRIEHATSTQAACVKPVRKRAGLCRAG